MKPIADPITDERGATIDAAASVLIAAIKTTCEAEYKDFGSWAAEMQTAAILDLAGQALLKNEELAFNVYARVHGLGCAIGGAMSDRDTEDQKAIGEWLMHGINKALSFTTLDNVEPQGQA